MIAIRNAWGEKRVIPNSDSPELGTTFDTRGKTMKKVLLATTALVMTAGVAAAEVSVTGSVDMGMKYDGSATATSKTTQHTDVAINFEGSVETDGGLTLSAFTAIISTNEAVHGNNGTGVSWAKLTYKAALLTLGLRVLASTTLPKHSMAP
jgi:hypothetical protein